MSQIDSFLDINLMNEFDEENLEEENIDFDDIEEMEDMEDELDENIEVNVFRTPSKGIENEILKQLKKQRINKSTRTCIFCQDEFEKNQIIRILPCKHYFHNKCLKPWFKKNSNCPMCRFDIKNYFDDE